MTQRFPTPSHGTPVTPPNPKPPVTAPGATLFGGTTQLSDDFARIRAEMEAVIRLNPSYEGGAGYRVMGVIDYKVPGFAGGDKKRAEERLLQAFALDPKNPYTVYYLGEYYHTVGNKTKAEEYFKSLETLEVTPEHGPDLIAIRKKAAALLAGS
jgi:tetratricopeptide (TPR) repeat protein